MEAKKHFLTYLTLASELFSEVYVCLWCTDSKSGPHKGLDIVCADGATVYAPFDVKLDRKAVPYKNQPKKEPINDGIQLSGEGVYIFTSVKCYKAWIAK